MTSKRMSQGRIRGGAAHAPEDPIGAYCAEKSVGVRRTLEAVARAIRAAAPDATASLSYGMPAFRLNGRPLVAFGAAATHCALYSMSPEIIPSLGDALEAFDTSKGTIRFTPEASLPAKLVKRVVAMRVAQLATGDATPRPARPTGARRGR